MLLILGNLNINTNHITKFCIKDNTTVKIKDIRYYGRDKLMSDHSYDMIVKNLLIYLVDGKEIDVQYELKLSVIETSVGVTRDLVDKRNETIKHIHDSLKTILSKDGIIKY